jgi:thioredoxin reductase (NADPH)
MRLTVLSRAYCHLCDDLIAALNDFQGRATDLPAFSLEIIDIDDHADLERQWGDKVPVLLDERIEIFRYFMDEEALIAHLRQTMTTLRTQ